MVSPHIMPLTGEKPGTKKFSESKAKIASVKGRLKEYDNIHFTADERINPTYIWMVNIELQLATA